MSSVCASRGDPDRIQFVSTDETVKNLSAAGLQIEILLSAKSGDRDQ
jgi:hypothetical protein